MGMLKEPRESQDGLSASKGRHFSISKIIKFRQPRKKPHKTLKATGKELRKMLRDGNKFMHEVYKEG